jgi:hypothetical protein
VRAGRFGIRPTDHLHPPFEHLGHLTIEGHGAAPAGGLDTAGV